MSSALERGVVELWRIDLREEQDEALLDAGERERAARFRFPEHRRRYVAAHVAVRRILAGYIGEEPKFDVGEHGKPGLAQHDLQFNLSHSRDVGLFAVAASDVGVDVEWMRADAAAVEIARRFFAPKEADRVREREGEERHREFFRVWSAKEAFLKGTGAGLSSSPSSFELEFDADRIVGVCGDTEWRLAELDVGEGWAAAVAVRAQSLNVRWKTLGA